MQLAMVIDLRKCVGCGACALSCKTENNTENRKNGQTFNWADYYAETSGDYMNPKYKFLPVLCNHCTDAPCIEFCLGQPTKALYKSPEGLTLHKTDNCIGCRQCQVHCPFSVQDVDKSGDKYSVVSFNFFNEDVHSFWRDTQELIPGCTASGKQTSDKAGAIPPDLNEYTGVTYNSVRKAGKVEKCMFCYHRIKENEKPWCVESCPAQARIIGDMDDPNGEVRRLVTQYQGKRLKNNKGEFLQAGEEGTKPNVYYIRDFMTS